MTASTEARTGNRAERWPTVLRPQAWTAAAYLVFEGRVRRLRRDDRGDVPGWVLVTLMTAGLVTVIWALAGDTLREVFTNAIKDVKP